jgi:hypothetical protein
MAMLLPIPARCCGERLSQAQAQKLEARLEDLQVWEQRKVKESKAGPKAYTYYLPKLPKEWAQSLGASIIFRYYLSY